MRPIACVRTHEASVVATQLLSSKMLLLFLAFVVLPVPCYGLSSVEVVSARGGFHSVSDSHLQASADENDSVQVSARGDFHSIVDSYLQASADDNYHVQAQQRAFPTGQKLGAKAATGDAKISEMHAAKSAQNHVRNNLSMALTAVSVLTIQYFVIYSILMIMRMCGQLSSSAPGMFERTLENMTSYANVLPMLCVLFLVMQLCAQDLTIVSPDLYGLPAWWIALVVDIATVVSAMVFIVHLFEACVMVSKPARGYASDHYFKWFRMAVMLCQYVCVAVLVIAADFMTEPYDIWLMNLGVKKSYTEACLMYLTVQYFIVYFALFMSHMADSFGLTSPKGTSGQVESPRSLRFEDEEQQPSIPSEMSQLTQTLRAAAATQNLGPMLAVVIIVVRLLMVDTGMTGDGNVDRWLETFSYLICHGLLLETVIVIISMTCVPSEPRSISSGENAPPQVDGFSALRKLLLLIRWAGLLAIYVGVMAIFGLMYFMETPDGHLIEDVPPSIACTVILCVQYFATYLVFLAAMTGGKAAGDGATYQGVPPILQAAKDTVTFCPMICILMLGARMHAMQLHIGGLPWIQYCFAGCVFAVLLQLVLVVVSAGLMGRPAVPLGPQRDLSGDAKMMGEQPSLCAQIVWIMQLVSLVLLYCAVIGVIAHLFMFKPPQSAPGTNIPGLMLQMKHRMKV